MGLRKKRVVGVIVGLLFLTLFLPLSEVSFAATPPIKKGGIIPDSVDWSHLEKAVYRKTGKNIWSSQSVLPTAFDLRNEKAVTPVKDQLISGSCWAFGTLASLESTQLKQPQGSLISTWNNDLSEKHLAWFAYKDIVAFTENGNDGNVFEEGGNFSIATAILSRGTGPIDEVSLSFNTDTNPFEAPTQNANYYDRRLFMNEVYRLRMNENPNDREETIAAVKELIQTKGAVAASYCTDVYDAYNEGKYSYCAQAKMPTNHAVAIMGWNDNFLKEDFNFPPEKNGAWLIKNSWGDEWGNNGYFWLSYYDPTLEDIALFMGGEPDTYATIYLHDPLGYTEGLSFNNISSIWGANVFEASKTEQIEAIAFHTPDVDISYRVWIFTDLNTDSDPTSGTTSGVIANGTQKYAGYHTVQLDRPIEIEKNQKFSVIVHFIGTTGNTASLAIESGNQWRSRQATSKVNESFCSTSSNTEPANIYWTDLNQNYSNGNVCIKALGNPIPETDSTEPSPGNSGAISTSNIIATSLRLNWEKGTDDITAQNSLRYYVYRSIADNINTVADCKANGTLLNNNGILNIATFNVSGLTAETTYYFNVVIQDRAGNKAAYTTKQQTTNLISDATPPTPGDTGTLLISNVTGNSLTLNWAQALDDLTDIDSLKYYVYRSTSNNINTIADCEANGRLLNNDGTLNITTFEVSGLTANTTYYFNVIVQDLAGNKAAYTTKQQTTNLISDTTPPIPGNTGTLSISDVTGNSLTLNWAQALDDLTDIDSLKYYVYHSTSNNINTVADCEANGRLLNNDGTLNITTFEVSGLTANTTYYFNVIVQDLAGNKAAYMSRHDITEAEFLGEKPDMPLGGGEKLDSSGGGGCDIANIWGFMGLLFVLPLIPQKFFKNKNQ
jgi:C1A family cysteine protease/chitodextrinase